MTQAQSLTTFGDRPLIVVTAARDAQDGWMALQVDLASLSSNSLHRVFPRATHTSLTKNKGDAAAASEAIHDVVIAVRTGKRLATR